MTDRQSACYAVLATTEIRLTFQFPVSHLWKCLAAEDNNIIDSGENYVPRRLTCLR
jgi:hypothetical protein